MKAIPQFLFLILILGVFLWREAGDRPFNAVDRAYAGWLLANAHSQMKTVPLTLVEIEDSGSQAKNAWPWKPMDYALFMQTILPFQPAVIGIVPPLEWKKNGAAKDAKGDLSPQELQYKTVLHDFLLKAPKLLLASKLGDAEDSEMLPPMQEMPTLRHIKGNISQLPAFNIVEEQPEESLRLTGTLGFTNLNKTTEEENKMPLLFGYRGEVVPSFVLQAAMFWLKLTPDDVKVELGSKIQLGDKCTIPIDARGAMRVDFNHRIARVGFEDLLLSASQKQAKLRPDIPDSVFQKKVVLLARADSESQTETFANGEKGSPGEWFANGIATIQSQTFIHRVPMAVSVAVILLAMLWGALALRVGKLNAVMASIFLLVIYLLLSLAIFQKTATLMPLLLPAGLLAFIVFYCLAFPAEPKKPAKSNDGH